MGVLPQNLGEKESRMGQPGTLKPTVGWLSVEVSLEALGGLKGP